MYVMGIATSVTINLPFRCGARCIIKYITKLYSKLPSLQQIDIMKFLSMHLYGHYAEYHFVIIRGLIMSKHRLCYVKWLSYVGCLVAIDWETCYNCNCWNHPSAQRYITHFVKLSHGQPINVSQQQRRLGCKITPLKKKKKKKKHVSSLGICTSELIIIVANDVYRHSQNTTGEVLVVSFARLFSSSRTIHPRPTISM